MLHTDTLAGVRGVKVVVALTQGSSHGAAGHGHGSPLVRDVPSVHTDGALQSSYYSNLLFKFGQRRPKMIEI